MITSVKDKIDEQALIIGEEENQAKEKGEYYRRKEEKLRVIKHKIEMIREEERLGDSERKETLIRDCQIDYDKYLKLY